MLKLRRAKERGHSALSWLDSWHSFSFDSYYDPEHNNFGPLRVINEDIILGGGGFGTHPHSDMEILTYVLTGTLEHKDSLGNGSLIKPGELQKMSAGTGIRHSEFNHSASEPVHLLQIWIIPAIRGLAPSYEQKVVDIKYGGGWQLIAAPTENNAPIAIQQDVSLYAAKLNNDEKLLYAVAPKRMIWLQVAEGELQINTQQLSAGDAMSLTENNSLEVLAKSPAHILLFDMAQSK